MPLAGKSMAVIFQDPMTMRCHYPLGDPDRDARIAADGPVGAKAAP